MNVIEDEVVLMEALQNAEDIDNDIADCWHINFLANHACDNIRVCRNIMKIRKKKKKYRLVEVCTTIVTERISTPPPNDMHHGGVLQNIQASTGHAQYHK